MGCSSNYVKFYILKMWSKRNGKGRVIAVILPFFLHIPRMLDREQASWTNFEIKLLHTVISEMTAVTKFHIS